jgi:hypothetical protein
MILLLLHSSSHFRFKQYKDDYVAAVAAVTKYDAEQAEAAIKVLAAKEAASAKKTETWDEVHIDSIIKALLVKYNWFLRNDFLANAHGITRLFDVLKGMRLPQSATYHPERFLPMIDRQTGERIYYEQTYTHVRDGETGDLVMKSNIAMSFEAGAKKGATLKKPTTILEAFESTRRFYYSCVVAAFGLIFKGEDWLTPMAVAGYLELLHVVSCLPGLTLHCFILIRDESLLAIVEKTNNDVSPISFTKALGEAREGLERDMREQRKVNAMRTTIPLVAEGAPSPAASVTKGDVSKTESLCERQAQRIEELRAAVTKRNKLLRDTRGKRVKGNDSDGEASVSGSEFKRKKKGKKDKKSSREDE